MNTVPARQTQTTAQPPRLEASLRRLLADPFRPTDEWQPPDIPPETQKLRAAKAELERGTSGGSGKHMRWCLAKLSALPSKDGQELAFAMFAENFLDVCGEYPDDLWTEATLELLKTKTWRPVPSEFITAVGPKLAERKRMIGRLDRMIAGTVKPPAGPFVPEPLEVRLRTLRDALKRIGAIDRAAVHERELAALETRQPEQWAA